MRATQKIARFKKNTVDQDPSTKIYPEKLYKFTAEIIQVILNKNGVKMHHARLMKDVRNSYRPLTKLLI